MAGESGQAPDNIVENFCKCPFKFGFFRALRLLQNHYKRSPRIGTAVRAKNEPFRFAYKPSLKFAPSTIASVKVDEETQRLIVTLHFLGLLGANGPMPFHLTEYIMDRIQHGHDTTLSSFLDVFHHRIFSLFFKAWALNNQTVDFELQESSRFAIYIGSLIGIGMQSLQNRDTVLDWSKLYFAGRLVSHTRNAEGLEAIIKDYFGVPATIEQFCGQWLSMPPDSRCRLGESPATGTLGLTTIVGFKVWDCQLKFRIRLGPMGFEDFFRMLPSGDAFQRMRDWILAYLGCQYFWDLKLVLKKEEVPPLKLGQTAYLGWTMWLKTKPLAHNLEDLILYTPAA